MRGLWRTFRTVAALLLAIGTAGLPACGSMGGGMHYLVTPAVESVAT